MVKKEYIAQIKDLLLEDLNSKDDLSPNGMLAITLISGQYQGKVPQDTIDAVMNTSRWIQTYLMHCRHMARPVDSVLVTNLINFLEYGICHIDGEDFSYNQGCVYLTSDFSEMIRRNHFDKIFLIGDDGDFRDDLDYISVSPKEIRVMDDCINRKTMIEDLKNPIKRNEPDETI